MLPKQQYAELLKYRSAAVPAEDITGTATRLIEKGLIKREVQVKTELVDGVKVTSSFAYYLITEDGKDALEEFEVHMAELRSRTKSDIVTTTIGLLTLAATVILGILGLLR